MYITTQEEGNIMKKFLFIVPVIAGFACYNVVPNAIAQNPERTSIKTKSITTDESHIEKIIISSNLHLPKELIIGLNPKTIDLIEHLYYIIRLLNEETIVNKTNYPFINLHVIVPDQYIFDANFHAYPHIDIISLQNRIKDTLPMDTEIPYFKISYVRGKNFPWIQDILESGAVYFKSYHYPLPVIFNLNYNGNNKELPYLKSIKKSLNINELFLDGKGAIDSENGDCGGNIEATHENKIYVGNNITDRLSKHLMDLSGNPVIKLDTKWLIVSHVDELLFFIPSKDRCGAALVYADPLEALYVFTNYGDLPVKLKGHLINSLKYFLKPGRRLSNKNSINDFNINKPMRKEKAKDLKNITIPLYSDWFVLHNLKAYKYILKNVLTLQKNSSCLKTLIPIPVLFQEAKDEMFADTTGIIAINPFPNAIVLRDHIIMPKGMFQEITEERLVKVIGNKYKIHFVDASWYHGHDGSIHCATAVIRDPEKKFKMK